MKLRLDEHKSIPDAFFNLAKVRPELELYKQAQPGVKTVWSSVSYAQAERRICAITQFLSGLNLGRGFRAAILSTTRPEWLEADIAIMALGGVTVSIYPSLPAAEAGYILNDSGAEVVFVENEEQLEKIRVLQNAAAGGLKHELKSIVSFENCSEQSGQQYFQDILSVEDAPIPAVLSELSRGDLAALVYTSGTTGVSKGVMQTHGNHLSNLRQSYGTGLYGPGSSIFLFLPLAHSFARLMGYIGMLTEVKLSFAAVTDTKSSKLDLQAIARNMHDANATIIPIVPRVLEKIAGRIREQSRGKGFGAKLLRNMLLNALAHYRRHRGSGRSKFLLELFHVLNAPLRGAVRRKLFGSKLSFVVSGGARLKKEVAEFFDALGVEILEGYGLTETCVALTINRFGKKKLGTVGLPMSDDIDLELAEDGELLVRGPNVTSGYYGLEEETAQAWDSEGYFHTGDLCEIDSDGFLKLCGRKKEIIVTAYGKNIAPEMIEQQLDEDPLISCAMLAGEAKPYLVALFSLDRPAVLSWAEKEGLQIEEPFSESKQLLETIHKSVEKINGKLSPHETVKRFAVLDDELSIDNGLLTPTFKVRRALVLEKYRNLIEGLYRGHESIPKTANY